ncbi:hypothetical protein [Glaciecola petra]|uniref:Cadherin domain-containing protein n=1 Tax=Glaciecola petra TaxID=3075602 RepID=A0ABU2ZSG0_9ALTE|nr:hypothetical protein [Aestuariibacter sp. P117]MDT0594968.1 hypothetical protein [Aestuariibacter sp. P117]
MQIMPTRLFTLFLCCAFLINCGGGGGGGGVTPVPVPTPPPNQAPSFNSPTEFTFAENELVQFVVSVSDPDGDTVTISDAGTGDGGFFQLNTSTGQVTAQTQNGAFNFEDPLDSDRDNVYVQTFNLNDGTTTVTATVTVTITNVVEAPSYLGATDFEAGEGVIGFAISATDNDSSVLEFALSGADAGAFTIADGGLNFNDSPDFESPADADMNNVYEVVLSITNSEATIEVNLTATITNVDEPPVCQSAESFTIAENASGEIYRFTATDPEGDAFTFENFVVTAENLLFDSISLDSGTGAVTLSNPIDFEALTNPVGQLSVSVGEVMCSAEFTVLDLIGTATSGLKLLGGAVNIEPIGDVDGDGINDLWMTTQVGDDLEGLVVFGDYLADAMPAAVLDTSTAMQTEVLPVQISASMPAGGSSKTLTARAVGDIDGDNIGELLVAYSLCEGCTSQREMAYLIWGSTIQNNTSSGLILDELNANQILPLSFQSEISSVLSFASGDFDGDGLADIAFGLPTPVEESFVVFGDFLASAKESGTIDLVAASQTQVLDLNIDYLSFPFAGEQMASVEDINSDGLPELVLTRSQWVQVVHSSTIAAGRTAGNLNIGTSFDIEINATSGIEVLSQQAFDLEGDGIPEIAWSMPIGGLANVAIGSTYANTPNSKFVDDTANNLTSSAISSINDLSGGGFSELVLTLRTSVSPDINEIRVITGETLTEVDLGFSFDLSASAPGQTLSISGLTAQDSLAATVASLEDLDGDGLNELIVSDAVRGETYLIRGADIAEALSAGETSLDMNALFNSEL